MRKIFLSAAIIALSFAAFSFNPINKKAPVSKPLIVEPLIQTDGCVEFFETAETFTRCYKTSSDTSSLVAKEVDVLNKL